MAGVHPRYKWLSDWLYYSVVLPLTARLPARWGIALARRRGRHFAAVDPARRARIAAHLNEALHPIDAEAVSRLHFENEAVEELEAFYYESWQRDPSRATFQYRGLEHLDRALSQGRGALLLTAHVGSFCSAVPALAARGYQLNYVAHNSPADPRFSAAFRNYARFKIDRMARAAGRDLILFDLNGSRPRRKEAALAAFAVLDRLRDNELVSVAVDVPPRLAENTTEVLFLGTRCRFPTGFLKIARLNESPVIPYATLRPDDDWTRLGLVFFEPVLPGDDPKRDLTACLAPLEAAIRRHPEQWLAWDVLDQFRV